MGNNSCRGFLGRSSPSFGRASSFAVKIAQKGLLLAGEENDNHSHLGRQAGNNKLWIEVDNDSVLQNQKRLIAYTENFTAFMRECS